MPVPLLGNARPLLGNARPLLGNARPETIWWMATVTEGIRFESFFFSCLSLSLLLVASFLFPSGSCLLCGDPISFGKEACRGQDDERSLKELSEEILESMILQKIPSCASSGHHFTVKEKCKMKSATAKSFLIQVKEFFSIADEAMDEFVVIADNKRKAEGEVITALECKSVKKSADQTGGDASTVHVVDFKQTEMSTLPRTIF